MEFLHTLFASTAVLWCTLIGLFIAVAILLENEFEGWATTLVSISLALVIWLNQEAVFDFIKNNPSQLLGFIGSYIVVGVIWSIVKWQLYVRKAFKPLKEVKAEFISKFKVLNDKTLPELNKMISVAYIKKADGYSLSPSPKTPFEDTVNELTPIAYKKKGVITSWVSYWPISLSATLLNNPFRNFFEWLYENISGLYERITNANKKSLLHD
jgi:hypothetical protein